MHGRAAESGSNRGIRSPEYARQRSPRFVAGNRVIWRVSTLLSRSLHIAGCMAWRTMEPCRLYNYALPCPWRMPASAAFRLIGALCAGGGGARPRAGVMAW